jgi:transposase
MPAQYVKPYVKTNESEYIDAEAIAEAVGRPKMRFVPRLGTQTTTGRTPNKARTQHRIPRARRQRA